jgi:single-strand DNA-binding protein
MTGLRVPELNRVLLSGRLTRDPEIRFAGDGTQVTSFTLAFNRRYRDRSGAWAEQSGFVGVVAYQKLAELCGEHLKKGSPVLVEGRLQAREWTDRQGGRQQRLEIRAENVHFLEKTTDASGLPGLAAKENPEQGGAEPF